MIGGQLALTLGAHSTLFCPLFLFCFWLLITLYYPTHAGIPPRTALLHYTALSWRTFHSFCFWLLFSFILSLSFHRLTAAYFYVTFWITQQQQQQHLSSIFCAHNFSSFLDTNDILLWLYCAQRNSRKITLKKSRRCTAHTVVVVNS